MREHSDWFDTVVAVVLVGTLLAGIGWLAVADRAEPPATDRVQSLPELEPLAVIGTPERERTLAADASVTGSGPAVYVCESNGQRVYSDRACGDDARLTTIEPSRLSTYAPSPRDLVAPRPASAPSRAAAPRERAGSEAVTGPDPALCRSIEQEIERIDARMRAGYTSQEGEYWRKRRHAAKERHHEVGCTWRR